MANHLERLAFIDETSVKTNMARTTGWSPCGQRLVDHAPFGHWRTQTFIAALRHDRLDAPWVIDGAMNAEMFTLYIETQLVPTLRKGDVVILDNLSSHKVPAATALLRDVGAWFRCSGKTVHWTLFFPLQPAAVLTRSEPHRDGLFETQGADQESRSTHLCSTLGRRRTCL